MLLTPIIVAGLIAVHGLIHLFGTAKGFGFAQVRALTQPISPRMGFIWLVAAGLHLAFAAALLKQTRGFWAIGMAAVVVSQIAIVYSWQDAKFGTVANVLIAALALYGYLTHGPTSFRAIYDREVKEGLSRPLQAMTITESDLLGLPLPVQRYLRVTGFVGQPRIRNFRAEFRGRIRRCDLPVVTKVYKPKIREDAFDE